MKIKGKKSWYYLRDWNTKFFHACVGQRHLKNAIREFQDRQGHMVAGPNAVDNVFKTIL